ncbi:MAG TPA: amino acid permease [Candidatus Latescibacteria bacterium]|nr:amino acid permease [Candidatus Latescibacterota bacterium]
MERDLKKGLTFLDVFCVATGAMISSGLFILPGLAFDKAGPAVILSYLIAGIFCIPTLLSMAELTTAMPKAGGDYFYIMRGFGPLLGTVAGFSTWLSLSLKGAFALIGMGAYLSIITHLPLNIIALFCCLSFIVLNLIGVKEAGRFQVFLVLGLLGILLGYVLWGMKTVNPVNFSPFFTRGLGPMFATASFVFISYGGLTKVAALAEETKNPGKNLPLGMILSLIVTSIFYALVIFVTIGILNPERLKETLTPISDGAGVFGGDVLKMIISVGAFLAFISTANSGIMTASRYPLGMSRDKLLPAGFQKISSKFKTPYISILFTGFFMIVAILFLRLELLVKVASSVLILLYIFANLTLILFRESKISSFRPKFYSPFYPYLQILGILGGFFLLIEMGTFIIFLTTAFLLLGIIWYKLYAQKRATQDSALIYVLERLIAKDKELVSDNLLTELKDIVVQRDEVIKDKFHELIEESKVLDIEMPLKMEDFFKEVSDILSTELNLASQELFRKFVAREKESTTVIRKGLAIPHIVIEGKNIFKIAMARAKAGIIFPEDKLAHIIFILVGSSDERNLHLKVLAAIAQITQIPEFDKRWFEATNKEELKNIVLLAERRRG